MSANMGKKTLELEVEGLRCTVCAVSVEKTLANRTGVAAETEVVPDVFVALNSARLLKAPKRLFSSCRWIPSCRARHRRKYMKGDFGNE